MLPTPTGSGAAPLPHARFATGIAVITMGRQVGSAVGTATLMAIPGVGGAAAADFHGTWIMALAAEVVSGAHGEPRPYARRAAIPEAVVVTAVAA